MTPEITCEETGGETFVVCDDVGNNHHYALFIVNEKGAVLSDEKFIPLRLDLGVYEDGRVQLLGRKESPWLWEPGDKIEVKLGTHTITIEAGLDGNVLFNGKAPNPYTKELNEIRIDRDGPHTREMQKYLRSKRD